ncbi:hypothetical protein PoB_005151900 [Plakobranchus ocellatus]|uniref:PX domain-containing protein n=1 Tax=Plakobranchus ocellatus TaxID=259542 RepID=A0AAV4C1L4_9GAST|nr:hypothetical protein PoB_005151900 [Plakobranchus ocellatus]
MKSEYWLSVSLLLALCSNASLLLILTYRALNHDDGCGATSSGCREGVQLQQPLVCPPTTVSASHRSSTHDSQTASDFLAPSDINNHNVHKSERKNGNVFQFNEGPSPRFETIGQAEISKFLNYLLKDKAINVERFNKIKTSFLSKKAGPFLDFFQQLKSNPSEYQNSPTASLPYSDSFLNSQSDHKFKEQFQSFALSREKNEVQKNLPEIPRELFNRLSLSEEETVHRDRQKRDLNNDGFEAGADGNYLNYDFQFSKFTNQNIGNSTVPVLELLIPALTYYEQWMVRHVEELHFTMVSHDLRLERLEKAVLNLLSLQDSGDERAQSKGDKWQESPQADTLDNLTNEAEDVLQFSDEDKGLLGNNSLEVVMSLENYNTMSDSELNRVRSEVMRMDDKVVEMKRVQKNADAIAGMHSFKITELEMAVKRTDVVLNTALDSYTRLDSRVATFKDRLRDFSREVHSVTVHFSRHEQISNELRTADSYKAHDIMELRKTMLGLETRLSDLYSIMDQNINAVRTDLHDWLERLCFNNKLAC